MSKLRALFSDENGQDLAEYALVFALVVLGSVAAAKRLGQYVSNALPQVGSTLVSAT
jgi:Flp pilus assembly pilin Flp